jgi:hypothetical protein
VWGGALDKGIAPFSSGDDVQLMTLLATSSVDFRGFNSAFVPDEC